MNIISVIKTKGCKNVYSSFTYSIFNYAVHFHKSFIFNLLMNVNETRLHRVS